MFTTEKTPFELGKAEIYKDGKDVTIIACGILVYQALLAAKELEKERIEATVINCHTVKPLDGKTITDAARNLVAELGWDPSFGARPLKRIIQQKIENPLAGKILSGEIQEGVAVTIDAAGKSFQIKEH